MTTEEAIRVYSEEYRGEHTAPASEYGASLDMAGGHGVYPEDIYSYKAVQYYGDGTPFDSESISVIQSARNKPNSGVKVYRAVPKVITKEERINKYLQDQKYIMKHGKLPPHADNPNMDRSEYYEWTIDKIEWLKQQPDTDEARIKINSGDWVTISKGYAREHGKNLGNFRILTKTVMAKQLFTDGNSIHEWGYHIV